MVPSPLTLLPSYSFLSFPLSAICFAVTRQDISCSVIQVLISYLLYIYTVLSLLALYVSIVTCALGSEFLLAFTLFIMAKRKRTPAQFFDNVETHGLEPLMKIDLKNDEVSKHLESSIDTNYTRILVLWDESVSMSSLMITQFS